jgi:uncharacterized protein (UPF0333 family)
MNRKTTNRKTARKAGAMSIETILLLIVAIVAVGIAFLFYMGYIGSAAVNPKAAIQQFDITVASDGSAAITLVIKNTGNVRITGAAILGWTGLTGTPLTLTATGLPTDPGKTFYFSGSTAAGGPFVLGNQYGIRVQITYANGATEVLTAQATAHP